MQAAWQALHPMQRETSMSFATSSVLRAPGGGEVAAERAWMSSDWRLMAVSSSLLDVHQESLELGLLDVGVAYGGGEGVHHVPRLGEPFVPPVDRDADGVDFLALDPQGLDALRDQGLQLDLAALRADHDQVAVADALLPRQLLAQLHERLGLEHRRYAGVLAPEVEVLGEPVGGGDDGELLRRPELLPVALVHASRRVGERLG